MKTYTVTDDGIDIHGWEITSNVKPISSSSRLDWCVYCLRVSFVLRILVSLMNDLKIPELPEMVFGENFLTIKNASNGYENKPCIYKCQKNNLNFSRAFRIKMLSNFRGNEHITPKIWP